MRASARAREQTAKVGSGWQDGSAGKGAHGQVKPHNLVQFPEPTQWKEKIEFYKLSSDRHVLLRYTHHTHIRVK